MGLSTLCQPSSTLSTFEPYTAEGNVSQGKVPVGDGQLPPLDRPPTSEMELRRLIDFLADPVAFAQWFARLMQQTDPAEELAAPESSEYEGE